jgi:pilus assembly protein CpaB
MNRKRLLIIGIVAVLIAFGVSVKMLNVVQERNAPSVKASTDIEVLVAGRDLGQGEKISSADLRSVRMPAGAAPADAFRNKEDVVGHGVLLPMRANEVLLSSKVTSDRGAGLTSVIPAGMRAVSVKVNEVVAVAGFVVPGTFVDVIVTGNPGNRAESSDVTTTTILQHVKVLAAGKKMQETAEGKPEDVPVITLLVSPADAQLLTLASSEGRIQLALRNPADTDTGSTEAVKIGTLYGAAQPVRHAAKGVRAPKAVAPVAPVYTVEVIRGDKREVTKF